MQNKKTYREVTTMQMDENKNIVALTDVKESFIEREEPDFIKLYLDHVLVQANTKIDLSPLLMEILKMANYADDRRGGMYVILNKYAKQLISKATEFSMQMIDRNVSQLVSSKILIRIARGTYMINPYYFGKGHWTDIKKIRATIDFNTGEFIPELEFAVRDGGGDEVEGIHQDEDGNLINEQTGEIIPGQLKMGGC